MGASLSGVFNTQEWTDAGDPLVGGRLYTYAAGTTTQKVAYTDAVASVPHTYTSDGAGGQFIALDARGELPAPLYLAAGAYDMRLCRADGSTVWTRSGIKSIAQELTDTASDAAAAATAQAGASAAAAAASAVTAAAARDAAQLSAGMYATAAAGLAAVASGRYFTVPGTGDDALILYLNNGGVATEITRIPASARVAPLGTLSSSGRALVIASEYGKIVLQIGDDGTVSVHTLSATAITASSIGTAGGSLANGAPAGCRWAVIDGDDAGRMALGVRDDGTTVAAALETATLNGVNVAALIAAAQTSKTPTARRYDAEIAMVLSYGQSLSVGTLGVASPAVLTTSQRFDNLRFAGGVRSQDSVTPYTALVPLVEVSPNSTFGETPCAGATDAVKELIASEDGLSYTAHSYQLLASAPGQGGTAIAGLSKGTAPYNRFIADVQAGYTLAQAAGKSFKVLGFFWTQGESDYISNTAVATYKAALIQLRNDLDADIKAITGQAEDVACISYQTQGHATYGYPGNPYIAVAQYEVAKTTPHHYVACPLYWSAQSVHQSAANYKVLGAYYGIAYKRVVVDGLAFKPLMPVSLTRQGALVYVRCNVPAGKLTLDTASVPVQANYGFSLVDSTGAALTISSVTITGPDTIKITATAAIPAGARLRYGFAAGGNIRDSQGDTLIFDGGGMNQKMHNWMCIFEESLN